MIKKSHKWKFLAGSKRQGPIIFISKCGVLTITSIDLDLIKTKINCKKCKQKRS